MVNFSYVDLIRPTFSGSLLPETYDFKQSIVIGTQSTYFNTSRKIDWHKQLSFLCFKFRRLELAKTGKYEKKKSTVSKCLSGPPVLENLEHIVYRARIFLGTSQPRHASLSRKIIFGSFNSVKRKPVLIEILTILADTQRSSEVSLLIMWSKN